MATLTIGIISVTGLPATLGVALIGGAIAFVIVRYPDQFFKALQGPTPQVPDQVGLGSIYFSFPKGQFSVNKEYLVNQLLISLKNEFSPQLGSASAIDLELTWSTGIPQGVDLRPITGLPLEEMQQAVLATLQGKALSPSGAPEWWTAWLQRLSSQRRYYVLFFMLF